jgi:hypothetical protein
MIWMTSMMTINTMMMKTMRETPLRCNAYWKSKTGEPQFDSPVFI